MRGISGAGQVVDAGFQRGKSLPNRWTSQLNQAHSLRPVALVATVSTSIKHRSTWSAIIVELSQYVLEPLRKDEEFILYRGRQRRSQTQAPSALLLGPISTRPLQKASGRWSTNTHSGRHWTRLGRFGPSLSPSRLVGRPSYCSKTLVGRRSINASKDRSGSWAWA